MTKRLLDSIKHFENVGINSNPFLDKTSKNPLEGKCVYLNNAFGLYLQKYKNKLIYSKGTVSTLNRIQSIAGQFKKTSTESVQHTWLKLYFGNQSIQLDFTASQFDISGNLGNGLKCYLFNKDDKYDTNGAEIKDISERWRDIQELTFASKSVAVDYSSLPIPDTLISTIRYFRTIHDLIVNLAISLNE